MILTNEEEAMASGKYGAGIERCMDILIKFGEAFDAQKLVKISSAHVFNAFPTNLLTEMTQDVCELGAFTTIHPFMSLSDPINWRKMGIAEGFFAQRKTEQEERLKIYNKIDLFQTYTCSPILVGNVPKMGDYVSWFGSSVQVFINSVIGARQNRDGAVVNMAAAITGRAPYYGFYLPENRFAEVLVQFADVDIDSLKSTDYGAVGYYVGNIAQNRSVAINGLENAGFQEVRFLLTPLSTSGAVCICHIIGFTPEAPDLATALGGKKPQETIVITQKEIDKTKDIFGKPGNDNADLSIFGCPHCSIQELKTLAFLLKGKKVSANKRLWIATGGQIKNLAEKMGYLKIFENSGAVVSSSCMATIPDCPIPEDVKVVATNSFKTAHYVTAISKGRIKVVIGEPEECIGSVTES